MNTLVFIADTFPLQDEKLFSALLSLVPEYRKTKIEKLRFKKDKCLSLGAGLLFREALQSLGIDENAEICYGENGKPYIKGDSNVYFNLSHSENRAMCVVSEYEVGCDVEFIAPKKHDIAKRFFTEEEYDLMNSQSDSKSRENMFFTLWTLKESFIKCTGKGLATPLNSFSISVNGNGVSINQNAFSEDFTLKEINLNDGYKYALCIKAKSIDEIIIITKEFKTAEIC